MIVPMLRIYLAVRAQDVDATLASLGEAGVLEVEPIDPEALTVAEQERRTAERLDEAAAMLRPIDPAANAADLGPEQAATAVDEAMQRITDHDHRAKLLTLRLEDPGPWGAVRLDDLRALDNAGLNLDLAQVPAEELGAIDAELVYEIDRPDKDHVIVLVACRGDCVPVLPDGAEEIERPKWDRAGCERELRDLKAAIAADRDELARLRHLLPQIEAAADTHRRKAKVSAVEHGAQRDAGLIAWQGWVPEPQADAVARALARADIPAGITTRAPLDEEEPPSLVRYPTWAKPIEGLLKVLGTVAGYREPEPSAFFMVALPLFAAILISDAGYGLLLLVLGLVLAKKIKAGMGTPFWYLMLIIAGATMIWGVLTNGFFGFGIYGDGPSIDHALIPVGTTTESQTLLMNISFVIAAVHLSLAWLWQALRHYPDTRFLNCIGWAAAVWGMFGVVRSLLLGSELSWATPYPYLLIVGAVLAIVWHAPQKSPPIRLALGVANLPLELLGKFSDVVSYVRLMAVGLASSVLAANFNGLADQAPLVLGPIILVLGHSLNFALCMIALFAHGVRLNMLEFGNNLGLQWTGHAFDPFVISADKET